MKLYIANVTVQTFEFRYKRLESLKTFFQMIPRGTQHPLGDFQPEEVDYIVGQFSEYGMRKADDIARATTQISLLYQLDKHVTETQMRAALDRNVEIAEGRSADLRKYTAAAVGADIEKQSDGSSAVRDILGRFRETEFTIREHKPENNTLVDKHVDESFLVKRSDSGEPAETVTGRQPRGGKRGRRAA